MSEVELQARLQDVGAKLRARFPVIERVDATAYTDSTGDDAVRLLLVLRDPVEGGAYPYTALEPMVDTVYDLMAGSGLQVYVRFRLVSEDRELAAGTYYG